MVTSPHLSVCILFVLIIAEASLGCPDGWYRKGASCYRVVQEPVGQPYPTVYDARRDCVAFKGDLASLETQEESAEVITLLQNNSVPTSRAFIGFHDLVLDGLYHWFDGTEVQYTNWKPGEPNNIQGGEACVIIESENKAWQMDGKTVWKDYPCCEETGITTAICEINETKPFEYKLQEDLLANDCFKDTDDCVNNPCMNGATCQDKLLEFECVCIPGFTGSFCEKEIICPHVPVWLDMEVNTTDHDMGVVISYGCGPGFHLMAEDGNTSTAMCNEYGQWEPELSECVSDAKKTGKKQEETTEAPGAAALGGIALIFMSVELGIIVLMDLEHLGRHLVLMKNNICSFLLSLGFAAACASSRNRTKSDVTETSNVAPMMENGEAAEFMELQIGADQGEAVVSQ